MTDRRAGPDRRSPALGGRRVTDHGTRVAYQHDGCRCGLCVQAEAAYHAQHAKGLIAGWVDAGATRAHVQGLRDAKVGLRRVAALSGVSRRVLQRIVNGQAQIHPDTERRILGVVASVADGLLVDAALSYKTRERLRRFFEEQFSLSWLRKRFSRHLLELAEPSATKNAKRVRAGTWRRVGMVYQQILGFDE